MPSWKLFSRKGKTSSSSSTKRPSSLGAGRKSGLVAGVTNNDNRFQYYDSSSAESLSPDFVARTCICCGTILHVPKHLTAFKCGLCDTHIDLPPVTTGGVSVKRKLSAPSPPVASKNNSMKSHTRSVSSSPSPTLVPQQSLFDSKQSQKHVHSHSLHSNPKPFVLVLGVFERTIERAAIANNYAEVKQMIRDIFKSVDSLNHSFAIQRYKQAYDSSNIDFKLVRQFYDMVLSLPHQVPEMDNPINVMLYAMLSLLKRPGKLLQTPYDISFLLVFLENPVFYRSSLFAKPRSSTSARVSSDTSGEDGATIMQMLNRQISHPMSDYEGDWSSPTAASAETESRRPDQDLGLKQVQTSPASLPSGKPRLSASISPLDFSRAMALEILERTVGILVFTPKTCRQYIIKWFSRYSPGQFQPKIDLVNAYIANSLTRQYQNRTSRRRHRKSGSAPVELISQQPIFGGGLFALSSYERRNSKAREPGGSPANVTASSSLTGPQLDHITHWLPTIPGVSSRPKKQRVSAGSIRSELYCNDWNITTFVKLLSVFFSANTLSNSKIPISHFYNTMVDYIDITADFDDWQRMGKPLSSEVHKSQHRANLSFNKNYPTTFPENLGTELDYIKPGFSFCQYPFLLSMGSKTEILEYDARRQMELKAQEAFFGTLTNKVAQSPYLFIRVHRHGVLKESFEELERHEQDLKKSLRIEFIGEPGIDAGGLKKEWFMLVVKELFDPSRRIFTEDEESKFCWFDDSLDRPLSYYKLTGEIVGLALYNSTILDINFPLVLFKKLLGSPYCLDDFIQLHPSYGKSLRMLLTYDGPDFEETFGLNFCITKRNPATGEYTEVPLQVNGQNIPITKSNRTFYVKKVMSYYLDMCVERQFTAFKQGFYKVAGGNALSLFRPEEVELLLRGCLEPIDIDALRSVTKYQHWGTKPEEDEHIVIKWFWKFFKNLDPSMQRKLLVFVTGSDRIPATGITTMTFRITKIGEDCDRFPTSHTCFNQLCLYSYATRDKLESLLLRAICESEGFGMK